MTKFFYSREIYPKEVLIKSAFRFLDRAYIHIDNDDSCFEVQICPKEGKEVITQGEFDDEMLVQAARYYVAKQTKNIREITVGRAMASTLLEKETEEIEEEDDFDAEEILKDWFKNE